MSGPPLALRLDDVGAASKRHEVYARRDLRLGPLRVSGNLLFLKALPPFKGWGPYREMRPAEWIEVFACLESFGAVLTVGVTAAWVNWDGSLTPFPEKFPGEAAALREGIETGLVEIANHGLTHCVLADHAFRPAWRHGNRKAHREFWESVPLDAQEDHLRRSQAILQETFGVEVITFVPPGNVFTEDTLTLAAHYGLRVVSCATSPREHPDLHIIGNENVLPFHDREIVLEGADWLRARLAEHQGRRFCFVRDLAGVLP
jgi:peptidoglycan/xylan/chitin deacetylase (PgdA/CDA1 family)